MFKPVDFMISNLGECCYPSPIQYSRVFGDGIVNFANEDDGRVPIPNTFPIDGTFDTRFLQPQFMMERAGARARIFFAPEKVHAAILTCGGLCPGLNDVIRSLVNNLWRLYGVQRISGIRYGYQGLLNYKHQEILRLNPLVVRDIHKKGGTILGSSRGAGEQTKDLVTALEKLEIDILFVIGGDGTQRGALKISEEAQRRGRKIAVVGIPKTIDNDLNYIHKTFGFSTAVSVATQVVRAAAVESTGAYNGIGLVKLMGRYSGFIAAHAAVATHESDFVLIPEVPFELHGEKGFLNVLSKHLERHHHAVVLVAEGAGQEFLSSTERRDASGNLLLADIGVFIKEKIQDFCRQRGQEVALKYFDPSYIIRATQAMPEDAYYCARLGSNAVHAAMAGKTGMLISYWNSAYVNIPILPAVEERNTVQPESSLWRDVLEATGQPVIMRND